MNEPVNAPSTKPSRTKIFLVVFVTLLALTFFAIGSCFLMLFIRQESRPVPVVEPPAQVDPPNYTPAPAQP